MWDCIADSDGNTRRMHYEKFGRKTKAHVIPDDVKFSWDAFQELSLLRHWGDGVPSPITPSDIEAWCRVTGNQLCRHEMIEVLSADANWRSAVAQERSDIRDMEKRWT